MNRLIGVMRIKKLTGLPYSEVLELVMRSDFPSKEIISEHYQGWDEDKVQDYLLNKLEKGNSWSGT